MKGYCSFILLLICLGFTKLQAQTTSERLYEKLWSAEINAFKKEDSLRQSPDNSYLFIGSSSFRLWTDLAAAFPNLRVVNRGFGGSQTRDLNYFKKDIIDPHRPKAVIIYAGDNDVSDRQTPEQVLVATDSLVTYIHAIHPGVFILWVNIKPSPSRWQLKDAFEQTNQLIAELAARTLHMAVVDIWTPMLDATGQPRRELYLQDMLHMNAAGYEIWKEQLNVYFNQIEVK
jgi:lysophospholipase L1-like esterase